MQLFWQIRPQIRTQQTNYAYNKQDEDCLLCIDDKMLLINIPCKLMFI